MPKKAVLERSVLCKIRKNEDAEYLDYVTIKVIRTKQRGVRKQNITYSVLYDMGKSYRLPERIRRGRGPFTSIDLAMYFGMETLIPFMENLASLEYSFEDGIIEVGLVKTSGGFIAVASISDRNVHWTDEEPNSAEAVFAMEKYLFASFENVEKISKKPATLFPGHKVIWDLD